MHLATALPRAVDPPGCGCTDCLTGAAVPLDRATPGQIAALLNGALGNRTDSDTPFTVTVSLTLTPGTPLGQAVPHTARAEFHTLNHHLSWDLDPSQLTA